jgi:hypothetical protein
MFVRWIKREGRKGQVRWSAVLVEAVRKDGKPRQRHVAYLGSVNLKHLKASDARVIYNFNALQCSFWLRVNERFDELKLSPEDRQRLSEALVAKVAIPPAEDIASLISMRQALIG